MVLAFPAQLRRHLQWHLQTLYLASWVTKSEAFSLVLAYLWSEVLFPELKEKLGSHRDLIAGHQRCEGPDSEPSWR